MNLFAVPFLRTSLDGLLHPNSYIPWVQTGLIIALYMVGGKVVSHAHRPYSTPQKHYFSVSCTHLC
jgi:predicted tellurium resistance membrane protein TerC